MEVHTSVMAFSIHRDEERLSMKIKKVDDKPMVIRTKKKMELHTKEIYKKSYMEKDINNLAKKKTIKNKMDTTSKGKWYFKKRVNEVNSSIKVKSQQLKVAGAVSAGAVTNQIEGGKEVNEATGIAVAVSSPDIRGARMSAGKADRDKIDNINRKATVRIRKLKFFHDKLQKQDKQKYSLGKLVKDLLMGNLKNIAMKVMAILAPILMMLLPLIIIVGAIVGIVIAVIAFIYSTPLA